MKQPSADVGAASYPEYKTKLLQSHDKTWTDDELLLMEEQRKWLPEMETISSEATGKIFEMVNKGFKILNKKY